MPHGLSFFALLSPLVWALGAAGFQASPTPPAAAKAAPIPAVPAPKPRPGAALEGVVKGPDGKPIEGALVIARQAGASSREPLFTRTSADGRFRLPLPRTAVGPWDVRVEAKGRAAHQVEKVQPGAPLSVTLQEGRTITGIVRDGTDNRPLAGAIVEARSTDRWRFSLPWEPSAGAVTARTDGEGRFRLEGLENGLFDVSARALRYARAQRRSVRPGASVDLLLLPGASISGLVTGPEGRPVAGAIVAAQSRTVWGFNPAGAETTDARGRFSLLGVEPGNYWLAVRHGGLAPDVAEVTVEPLADVTVEISLSRGVPVLGRLMADRDRPLTGKVAVEELEGRRVTSRLAEILRAEAGPDGLFVVDRLPPGGHVLVVQAPGFGKRRVEFEVGARAASVDLGEILLDRGLFISGHVRNRSGAPIPDASVSAYLSTESLISPEPEDPVRTEADGAFVIGGLQVGRFTLFASAPGFASARTMGEAGADDVRIELVPGGSITGSVVDDQGRAIESFRLSVERLERDRQGGGGGSSRVKGVAAADGRFAFEDLAEGTYVVRATAPEMAPGTVSGVRVKAGQPTDAGAIRLSRGGIVRGHVVDTSGAAVAGATLTALPSGQRSWLDRVEGSSDGSGTFELVGVRPGRTTVTATHPDYAQGRVSGIDVDPGKGPAEAKVVLSIGGRVQGTVRKRDGTPLVGSQVEVLPRRAEEDRAYGPLSGEVSADGSFLVERVPPGPARASLQTRAGSGVFVGGERKDVTVVEGQTLTVEFVSREVLVSGQVTRSDAPVGGVRVTVEGMMVSMTSGPDVFVIAPTAGPQPFTGITAADGTYELIAPEPGDAWANVHSLDGKVRYASRDLQIPDVPNYKLDFKLGGVPVSGIVVDKESGEGVPAARLNASVKKGEDSGGASAGPDGRFAFELAPGEYTVSLFAEGYARSQSDLSVGAGGESDVRFELSRGLVLLGKVLDASGRPVAGVRVFAATRQGVPGRETAMTVSDGVFHFDRLLPMTYDLSAVSPAIGYAVGAGAPGDKDVALVLRPGGRLRLAVVDGRGAPVAGAFAQVVSLNGIRAFFMGGGQTDAGGLLEMSCPSGVLEISASQGKHSGKLAVEVSPGATVPARVVLRETPPRP